MNDPEATATHAANPTPATPTERQASTTRPRSTIATYTATAAAANTARPATCTATPTDSWRCITPAVDHTTAASATISWPRSVREREVSITAGMLDIAASQPRPAHRHLHAARTLASESRAAPQQRVGSLDRLDPKHQALLYDHRLTDIERADRARDPDTPGNIDHRVVTRLEPSKRAFRYRGSLVEQFMRADQMEALGLELLCERRQQAVITQHSITDLGEELRGAPIRPHRDEARTSNSAGDHQIADAVVAQQLEPLRGGAHPAPRMGHAHDRLGRGLALKRQHKYVAAPRPADFDEAARKLAAAGDNAELGGSATRHSPPSVGRSPGSNPHG